MERKDIAIIFMPGTSSPTTRNTLISLSEFSKELGFKIIGDPRRDISTDTSLNVKFIKYTLNYMIHFFKKIESSVENIIMPYPSPVFMNLSRVKPMRKINYNFLKKIKKNRNVIIYIHDLPLLKYECMGSEVKERALYSYEERIFNLADVLCVYNAEVRKYLGEKYGIEDSKFVEYEMLDFYYGSKPCYESSYGYHIPITKKICWAGNSSPGYIGDFWKYVKYNKLNNIIFNIYGQNGDWINNIDLKNVRYMGFFPSQDTLIKELCKECDYGILTYSQKLTPYLKYTSTAKLSTYMLAGLPVLINKNAEYPAHLVSKYNVGIVCDNIESLIDMVNDLSYSRYNAMKKNVGMLGRRIKEGFFYKRCILTSLKKLGVI